MGGFAWVTLATNDSYSLGALVLAHSLRRVNTAHQLAILITPGVSEAMRTQLSAVYNLVKLVDVLDSRDTANLALLARPELGITFTKLHCWRLTQFDKCVFLDADTIVLQNSDELFEREELSAAPDVGWPDCFNSGVFVYTPSDETYKSISDFALIHGTFDGGDQGLLNLYFSDWATKDIKKHLPFVYNVVSCVTYSYLPALKQFQDKLKIIHFIGATKPWLQPFDAETGLSRLSGDVLTQSQGAFIQLWWDIFCAHVHPVLSSSMAGLAGALSTITLGSPLSVEQSALQEHLRRQGWEEGHIDYMGRDSFDNIWRKICETLASGPSQVPASAAAPQPQVGPIPPPLPPTKQTEISPPKETKLEARRASVPQAERPVSTVVLTPKTITQSTVETPVPTTPPATLSAAASLVLETKSAVATTPTAAPAEPAVCPLPKLTEAATPTAAPAEPAVCPLTKPSEPAVLPPTEPAVCPLPKPSEPAVSPPSEPAACPLPKPSSPAVTPLTETTACPIPKPAGSAAPPPSEAAACPLPRASEPAVQAPVCPLSKPTESAITTPAPLEPVACPLNTPTEAVVPTAQPVIKPVEAPQTDIKPVDFPPKSQPEAPIKTEPATPISEQTPSIPTEKPDSPSSLPSCPLTKPTPEQGVPLAPSSTTPSTQSASLPAQPTPPQSPSEQSKPPKPSEASQPSTPTVITPTPPVSPPAFSSVTPASLTEKLGVQVEIPQTPPVSTTKEPAIPPTASGATGGDEPPIPPKRKGGKGGGAAAAAAAPAEHHHGKQQGKGGKGGKGKK